MVSYSTAKKMKSFKTRLVLLSIGMIAGLAYEAFATDAPQAATNPANPDPSKAADQGGAVNPAKQPAAEKPAVSAPAVPPQPKMVQAPQNDASKKPADDKTKFEVTTANKRIYIEHHTAEIITVPADVSDIFVADQEVADVVQNVVGVAYVYGKKPGVTTIFGQTKEGKASLALQVEVTYNVGPLKRAIAASFPNERVKVVSTPTGIILEGDVPDPITSRDILNIAQRYIGDKDTIINSLGIKNPTQVLVSVKVAEVNRTVLHQLNINLAVTDKIGDFAFGILTGRQAYSTNGNVPAGANLPDNGTSGFMRDASGTNFGSIGGRLTSKHYPSLDIIGVLDAMTTESMATILAEPNLVVLNGETAKVLLGGEFPYPVPQGNNTISVQFKQYGVQLDVTPTILSGNLINLHVRPEVSALDFADAVNIQFGGGQGTRIPALKTRRTETTVELASGSSLAIAGLLANQLQSSVNEYPGLAELPILGALFRSPSFKRNESELVIICTPYLVDPVRDRDLRTPVDDLEHSSFLGMILSGRLNNPRSTPEKPFTGWTDYLAASGENADMRDVNYETNLADQSGSGEPISDQKRGSDALIFNKPEYLGQGAEVSIAGPAGFYTE